MDVELRPARVTPPGRIIRRELDARGWTQKDLAEITGRPEQVISQIIQGRKQITSETALQLAAAFGTSADLWLNLEANYQLDRARQTFGPSEIERRSRLYTIAPVNELVKRGWIQASDSVDDLERQVCAFLGIASLAEQPCLAVNFRQGQAATPETAAEIAWVKRVERLVRAQTVAAYNPKRLRAALPDLLAFSNDPGGVKHAPDWMRGLGVHFVIVPHLPHTYLDGAAFTFEDHPVVALTLRHDRIDSFWFTLLHELAHIVAGHTGLYLDNLDVQNENQAESEANRLARNWLIDPDAFARFVAAHKPYFSRDAVRAFAESQGRHPGIIVGRLHYENLIPYKNLRAWLVKARPHLQAWIDVAEPSWQV
jgi:HTH-type transcriptional regulator/antitoxin HigA